MAKLKDKKMISEAIIGETKRCLAIINRAFNTEGTEDEATRMVIDALKNIITAKIIEDSPAINFYPELKKRILK